LPVGLFGEQSQTNFGERELGACRAVTIAVTSS
jgi:hypothetical protein